SRGRDRRERRALAVDHQHDLGPFAFLGAADLGAPFFAGANVPSAIPSSQWICRSPSSWPSSRLQASAKIPASTQALNRLQQVAGEGYRSGKSFHRAPVCRIHKMPSRHGRGGTRGRPPFELTGGSGKRSAIRSHWESLTNGGGAVRDPVVLGRRTGRPYRVISM